MTKKRQEDTPVAGSIIFTVTLLRGTPAQPRRRLPQWSDAAHRSKETEIFRGAKRLTGSDHRGGLGQAVTFEDWNADIFKELDHFQGGSSATRADVF